MAKQRNPNGMGSYKKRKDGRIQWTQKKDGKPRILYGRTPGELQEKVRKVSDLPITSNKFKVEEWFEKWLDVYIKPLKKKATYEQYRIMYEQHIKPVIGHRKLSGVKAYDIQSVIAKANERLSTKTMKHIKTVMNGGFSKAFDEKLIPFNPVVKIEIPNKQKKPKKILTTQELTKIFKSMENSRWIWAVRLMLVTGLRRGELLALKWTDIDFDNKRLTVDESNSSTGLGDTKSAKVHYVPLSDKAIEYLNGQREQLLKEYNPSFFNAKLKKDPLVFPNQSGVMIRPDSFYTMLSRFASKAGITASPHSFRHTFVYMTREAMDIKELQAVLGHDESTTTLDIYGDILNESMVQTAAKIDDVFDKINEEMGKVEDKKSAKIIQFKKKA